MKPSLDGVSVDLGAVPIVADTDLAVASGEKVGLVGPNSSGETTLLKTICRSVRPVAGTIMLGEENLAGLRQRDIARRAALVAQESPSDFDFSVEDVVALGRAPHQRTLDRESTADRDAITAALQRTGMNTYRARAYSTSHPVHPEVHRDR